MRRTKGSINAHRREKNANGRAVKRRQYKISPDHEAKSTYEVYTEIMSYENKEIDNAVYTLQRIRASSVVR